MKTYKIILTSFILTALSTSLGFARTELQVSTDSKLINLDTKQEVELKAGQSNAVEISSASLVSSPDRIPVILVPVNSSGGNKVNVISPLEADVVNKVADQELDQRLAVLMTEVSDIKDLIRQKRFDEASSKIAAIKSRHPSLAFVNFLEASLALVSGNKRKAIELTETGMKALPDYQEGQRFLKQLKVNK